MQAVILVGGEATRLRPLTCDVPKMMVPVLNRPFFELLIRYLKRHGVFDVVLALGRSSDQVEGYFGDGSEFGVRIAYSVEDSPMGTAGAVKNAERFLDDSFLVFNGDIFTEIDLTAMVKLHRDRRALATLALTPVDDPTAYGVVETNSEGMIVRFTEKPSWDEVASDMINAGIYVMEPEVLEHITAGAFSMFERDVFPPLLEGGLPLCGYASHDYWIDMGTPEKYLGLQRDLMCCCLRDEGVKMDGENSVHPTARIEGPAVIGRGCCLERNAVVRGPVVLGGGCVIGEEACVEGAVLWNGCRVGRRALLSNCLLASDCVIGEGSQVLDGCVLGSEVTVGEANVLSHGMRVWPGKAIEANAVSF